MMVSPVDVTYSREDTGGRPDNQGTMTLDDPLQDAHMPTIRTGRITAWHVAGPGHRQRALQKEAMSVYPTGPVSLC